MSFLMLKKKLEVGTAKSNRPRGSIYILAGWAGGLDHGDHEAITGPFEVPPGSVVRK
jgi:hypothetical protein